ncbi:hypothetical protein INT43_000638 [Umbelopsis isabellina]|uniref:Uncharacterized protein n=1 Tax=Mortierella isabellina TaxID=91625 RepID=A0A8H7Q3N9_MORIS|nr:hypothetical protein INT43_000638 [Umbelopsis isabellina]
MGRSAKFFKRPTRKEKEQRTLNQTMTTVGSGIVKQGKHSNVREEAKKALEQTLNSNRVADQDVDMTAATAAAKMASNTVKEKEPEKRDYVDILTGKRTYRKPVGKFNKRHTIK